MTDVHALFIFPPITLDSATVLKGEVYYKKAVENRSEFAYDQALRELKSAITIFKKADDRLWLSKCYSLMGVVYVSLGEYGQAENYHKLAVVASPDDTQLAKCLINQAILQSNSRRDSLAVVSYERAKSLLHRQKIRNFDSYLYLNTGNALFRAQNYAGALRFYNLCVPLVSPADTVQRLLLADNIGITYLHLGELSKSKKLLDHNLLISEKQELEGDGTFYESMAKYYVKIGQPLLANLFCDKAIRCLIPAFDGNVGNLLVKRKTSQKLQRLYDYLLIKNSLPVKNSGGKMELLTVIDAVIDQMRVTHVQKTSKLFWREKTHGFYENAIAYCYKEKNYERVFYYIEKSRAILLLDAMKDMDARQTLPAIQKSNEQRLRYEMIGLQNKLASLNEEDATYTSLLEAFMAKQEAHQVFIDGVESSNVRFRQLKYDGNYLTMNELRSFLATGNQAFLTYFIGEKSVYALAITNTRVTANEINKAEFSQLSDAYAILVRKRLSKTDWVDFQQVSHRLFKLIFEPLHPITNRLIISPDGLYVPFEALLCRPNATKTDFLVQSYGISYAYSANTFFRKKSSQSSLFPRMLGVAPVNFDSKLKLSSLRGSETSLEKIEENYFSGKLLLNSETNKASFLSHLPNYEIIQLYTHGKATDESGASLIFLQNDVLQMNEFYGMKSLNAQLVVLSACETGIGKGYVGEGVESIARGFSLVGVPALVSTLWSVSSTATYAQTEDFYKHLKRGAFKDEALQRAKLDYLASSADYSPYQWAGMVLIGNTSPVVNRSISLIGFGILLMILIIGVIMFRKKKLPFLK